MARGRPVIEPPLVVIVGPTASGKTALAVRLAKDFGGEIISADSRAVYKELNIGTAKPDKNEQQGIPHWGIDLVAPNERFTAADFKKYASQKITDIRSRGRVPLLVGGTGLYVDSVVYDFSFSTDIGLDRRRELEALSIEELYEYCILHNIDLPENYKNKRYVVNNILREGQNLKRRMSPGENTIIVGITSNKENLMPRIVNRAEQIFSPAMLDEAQRAGSRYGWDREAMTGNIYPLLREYFAGTMTLEEAKERFCTLDWRLAKRQVTWLKRNKDIHWFDLDHAYTYIAHLLAHVSK